MLTRYHKWVEQILTTLIDYEPQSDIIVDRTSIKRFKDFTQFFVSRPDDTASLKIDMVNDVAPRYGDFVTNKILGKTDSWENILSNKIGALFRFEPKDIADIWIIAKNKTFNWTDILEEAKTKEGGVEAEVVYNIIRSFPVEKLDIVRWVKKPVYNDVKQELEIIANDLFYGKSNSL